MNPRYPQQQERSSPQDKKLATLAGLVGLTSQLQQPQLAQQAEAEHAHQNRVMAALQLLGLNNQQQEQQNLQGFRQQELTQRGDIAGAERQAQQGHWNQEADIARMGAGAHLFGTAAGIPGTTQEQALGIGGLAYPPMEGMSKDLLQQHRQQAIQMIAPQLQSITDPKAREVFGRAQLGKFPGAYEEAIGQPGAPAPAAPATAFTGREGGLIQNPFSLGGVAHYTGLDPATFQGQLADANKNRRASMSPEDIYNEQHPLDSVWNFLFGKPTLATH